MTVTAHARHISAITNDEELDHAIEEFYTLSLAIERSNAQPDAYMLALRGEIDRYEIAAGHEPGPPTTVASLLELEMFKRRQIGRAHV